jgi:hypothetical protein
MAAVVEKLPVRNSRAVVVLWVAALLVGAFIILWPVWAGIVATNDDIKFLREPSCALPVWDRVCDAWTHSASFRPLEIIVSASCDATTLACGWVMPVQALALVVLAWAVVGLADRVAPGNRAVAPIALLWIGLSPPTTTAAWQMDAASQTWSAALGAWGMLLAWRACAAARMGRNAWSELIWLTVVFAVGVNFKETMYGWSAAIGTATIVAVVWCAVRERSAMWRTSLILLPTVFLPVAHMAARVATGALGSAAKADPGARYQAELGLNVLVNSAMTIAGCLGNGPFHVLTDNDAPVALRVLPLLAIALVTGVLVTAIGFALFHRRVHGPSMLLTAALLAVVAFASTAATIPMGSVSELYCMGANVGTGILLAAAVVALWNPVAADERMLCRSVAAVAVAALAGVGAVGLAGRAYQLEITWKCTQMANDSILAFQKSVAPRAEGKACAGVIFFPASCVLDRTYGQYVLPPAQTILIDSTEPWLARRDPARTLFFSFSQPPGVTEPTDLVLDCTVMPARGHW